MSEEELKLCLRELRALFDTRERLAVLRLLATLAVVDGDASTGGTQSSSGSRRTGIVVEALAMVERETGTDQPVKPDTVP